MVTITVTCCSWAPSSGDHYLHVAPSTDRHTSSPPDVGGPCRFCQDYLYNT